MEKTADGKKRVLIIGGGFGGLACAKKLAHDMRFEVTLIDKTNHHLFQPLLYQVATASLAATDIASTLRELFERVENVRVVLDEIIDPGIKERVSIGKTGTRYEWDVLVLAVGAKTSFFGNDEWEEKMMGLKSLEDARTIRAQVLYNLEAAERSDDEEERKRLMTVAIVGGGPTGVELAGAFIDLAKRSMNGDFRRINPTDLRVVLIEASPRLLAAYDEDQSEYAQKRLERLGVEVQMERRVTNAEVGKLEFDNGTIMEAGAIIWSAGVQAQDLTEKLGVELADRGGRIEPNPDLSLPGRPDIFVIGDLVRMKDSTNTPVPGVAPAAAQMGAHVAKVLKADCKAGTSPRPAFRYRDKGLMAIIGKNAAVVKSGSFRLKGYPAWLAWLLVHILFLVGFRNKLVVLLGWGFAYIRNRPGARIISRTFTKVRQ